MQVDQIFAAHNITSKCSPFAKRVYSLLLSIPEGKVVNYRVMAQALDCKAYRAVGQVLRRNPLPVIIPCHRVVRSDLSLGGYCGEVTGPMVERKLALLAAEGVFFNANGIMREPSRCLQQLP